MTLALLDSRQLAVYTYQPATQRWYNPTTGGFETPFVAANHLVPLAVATTVPGPAANVITASTGMVSERTDVVTIVCTTTGAGASIAWVADVDIVQGPPMEAFARYTWTR